MFSGGTEFLLDSDGNLTIRGTLTTAGSCSVGCDRVFQAEYEVASIEEHAAFMWENRYLQGVGPTPEDGFVNISQKVGGLLNELEKAHIYIEQVNKQLKELQAKVAELEARLGN